MISPEMPISACLHKNAVLRNNTIICLSCMCWLRSRTTVVILIWDKRLTITNYSDMRSLFKCFVVIVCISHTSHFLYHACVHAHCCYRTITSAWSSNLNWIILYANNLNSDAKCCHVSQHSIVLDNTRSYESTLQSLKFTHRACWSQFEFPK